MGFAKRMAKLCLMCDNVLTMDEDCGYDEDGEANSVIEMFGQRETMDRVPSRSRGRIRSNMERPRSFSRMRSKSQARPQPQRSPQRRGQRNEADDAFFYDIVDTGSIVVGSSLSCSMEQDGGLFHESTQHQELKKKPEREKKTAIVSSTGGSQVSSEQKGAKQTHASQNQLEHALHQSKTAKEDAEYYKNIGSLIATTIDEKLATLANAASTLSFDQANEQTESSYPNVARSEAWKRGPTPILKSLPTSPKSVTFGEQDEEIVSMQPSACSIPTSPKRQGMPAAITSYSPRSSASSPSFRKVRSNSSVQASTTSAPLSSGKSSKKNASNPSPKNASGLAAPFQRGRSSPTPKGFFRKAETSSPVTIMPPSPRLPAKSTAKSFNSIPKGPQKMSNRQAVKPKQSQNAKQRAKSPRMHPKIHVTLHMNK